jgi:hypothetical protein
MYPGIIHGVCYCTGLERMKDGWMKPMNMNMNTTLTLANSSFVL